MGRVSYYWDGGDQAGNPLHYSTIIDDEEYTWESGSGFNYDDATFRTRKDSSAIFTGLDWVGHNDDGAVYAGFDQTISLGLIDANTAIDFEYIDLVFDFEGPNPEVDQQRISYYGFTDTFQSNSDFIDLMSTSSMVQTTNETGMPLILIDFNFRLDGIGLMKRFQIWLLNTRKEVLNSLLDISSLTTLSELKMTLVLQDVNSPSLRISARPRTGIVADGSRVRNDDRLEFTGKVVYQGSNVPAPRDASIEVEVFDGERIWFDGSLEDDGGYSVEVPLSSAETLSFIANKNLFTSTTGIPGKGEDMTWTNSFYNLEGSC